MMQDDASTQTGAGQIRPWTRILGKRPNPRADETPEGKMPRGLGGMECCQEEEIEIFGDREFFLSCLVAETDELEVSDDAGATEVALSELKAKVPGSLGGSVRKGGSSSTLARPTLADFPLEIGECSSSVDSRT